MDECSQKDRDQDLALLSLEKATARNDEWRHAHEVIHRLENNSIVLAREAMEKRLDGMNEFREALKDQQKETVSRTLFDLLEKRVSGVERLVPIVALLSAAVSAAITAAIIKAVGG